MKKLFLTLILFGFASFANNTINQNGWLNYRHLQASPKVKSIKSEGRSYFYKIPDDCCRNNKIFLIHGEKITSWINYKNYDYVYYINKNGDLVYGWMPSANLKYEGKVTDTSLTSGEFFVISKWGNIKLDTNYNNVYKFLGNKKFENKYNDFMNDNFMTVGGNTYKYFQHEYKGLLIKTSNINYIAKKRDFDDYRITSLVISDQLFITGRGIHVGSDEEEIKDAYGNPNKINHLAWEYIHQDMSITFNLNNLRKVETIELNVIPK